MTRKVVITGAGRGLGAILADLATTAGDDVQAAMRTPQKTSDLPLDMDSEESIEAFVATLSARLDQVDVLINNAGVDARAFGAADDRRGPFELSGDHVLATMRTNVVGPMLLTRALLPLLNDRSEGSVEFKHQNISAVLKGLGEDWIPGYKPAFNFQMTLVDAVARWLASALA